MKRAFPRPSLLIVLACFVLVVAGCTGGSTRSSAGAPEETGETPFVDCAGLTTPLVAASQVGVPSPVADLSPAASASPVGAAQGAPLPAVTLPCFTGGDPVDLSALRGPAVINLWASWCGPCRKELPALQRLADQADGKLRVIGVDTRDRRETAASLGTDLGVNFPQFFDLDQELLLALARPFVPVTVFIDAEGRIRHLDESGALDDATLGLLVERHLGVAVAS